MSWTPPSTDDFALHLGGTEEADLEGMRINVARATRNLQLATDLLQIATNCAELPPEDSALGRIAEEGVLSMAHYLLVREGDAEEMYSPFTSERIGSYSYSKGQMAAAARGGEETGVQFFDIAAEEMKQRCSDGVGSEIGIIAEVVMDYRNPATDLEYETDLRARYPHLFRDPSIP